MADFREYYNLDGRQIGKEIDFTYAAVLVHQLPAQSRVMREYDSNFAWNDATYLLAAIEYDIRAFMYGMSDPKKRPSEEPQPHMPKNKADIENEREKERALSGKVDGEKIEPVTPEMLKEIFGY